MCVYECVHIHAVSVNAKGMPPPGTEVTDGSGLPKVGRCWESNSGPQKNNCKPRRHSPNSLFCFVLETGSHTTGQVGLELCSTG